MQILSIEPRKALNQAFRKIKPNRTEIEVFKTNMISILDAINPIESEEFHKNLVINFLKKTYYDPNHFINTKGRNDLVIHNGKDAKSHVGVIIEVKSPTNKAEMITKSNLNCKALQELVLYYMRERITHKNTELKYIIVSNIYEWFIFDAIHFNKLFAENKAFQKQFTDFEQQRLSGKTTDYFYKEIAKPFIDSLPATVEFTHFDIRNYNKTLRNVDKSDDNQLISLFKLLSPQHLLKLSYANDSNSLDKNFYTELLHILGLIETKEGGKKIIQRNKEGQRYSGSLIENTINQLDSMDKLSRIQNPSSYGQNTQERLFAIALELTITWVNRILFLKLLEAQLISYQKGDKAYSFLNSDKIKDYDDLNTLFFKVLAKKHNERNEEANLLFPNVPYLNSSLFEMTELEHAMFPISLLENNKTLPLLKSTVIKDNNSRKATGDFNALQYFFSFLDAYDFASEGSEEIQEDDKSLINASVLGLIFEKINGYKDGSFFTPGFITMYMCRESIRRSVIQKFNEVKGWDCKDFIDLQNQRYSIKEANDIINSLKICDPAVGSGHFLVSALNEIISIKSKLEILADKEGRLLKHSKVIIENDELMIYDDRDGAFFKYNPLNDESQRIQETLFNEKQTIIENCLFGVDINPNSVKICRLRLWIELLKNAYYKAPDYKELETLPNIDINIKHGNSLISRFPLDADLKKALKDSKLNVQTYKNAVTTYHNAENKEQKWKMERLIESIKGNFRSEISIKDPKKLKLEKLTGELANQTQQIGLFERSKKEQAEWNKKVKTLTADIKKFSSEIEEIKSNKMYENAFEWRFEFPEVLDSETGDFIGFDTIIGNPPYIQLQKMGQAGIDLQKMDYETYIKTGDIYSLFYELGLNVLKAKGILSFITSNKWMRAAYGESLRKHFVEKSNPLILIDFGGIQVFDTATVDTNILISEKTPYENATNACILGKDFSINNISDYIRQKSSSITFNSGSWVVLSNIEQQIKEKIERLGKPLKEWDVQINYGIKTGYNEAFIIDTAKRNELIEKCPKADSIIRPILRGRDIKKYRADWAGLYIINTHTGYKSQNGNIIPPIEIDSYPAIKEYLNLFYTQLSKRQDKGITPYHLRSCIYLEDFYKKKLIYPDIMRMPAQENLLKGYPYFYFDEKDFFAEATNFVMTGDNIDIIYLFLTSDLGFFAFSKFYSGPQFDSTGFRYKKAYLDETFIPNPNAQQIRELHIIHKKQVNGEDVHNEINTIWANIVGLNDKELEFISLYKKKLLNSALNESNLII